MSDVNNSIATALASLTNAIATLASETARMRGFTTALAARNLTTFERATRPIRDGQW